MPLQQLPAKQEYKPLTTTNSKDYQTAKSILHNMMQNADSNMRKDIVNLEQCLISARTEMEESYFRLSNAATSIEQATTYLQRWRTQ